MMATDDDERKWEPIIGHLPIDHPDGNVKYDGYNLCINGHFHDDSITAYLPVTTPALTKTGRIAARQPPKPQKQPHTWWKAQYIFRGLPPKGTIAQLQERLRAHANTPISKDIRAIEARAKMDYKSKNNAAVENRWKNEMSSNDKVKTDARRYLKEAFPLKLEAEVVEAPVVVNSLSYGPSGWWTVVGRTKPAVAEKAGAISKDTQKFKNDKRRQEDETKRKHETLAEQQEQDLKEALAKCKDWDVSGTYKISYPYIDNWSVPEGDGLVLKVYWESTPKGPQMFAEFDFSIATGVFRFQRHRKDVKAPPPNQDDSKKRKREYDSEDEDEDEDDAYGDRRRSPTPDAFYFDSIPQPSSEHHTWNYRWRGEDSGEGEIDVTADKKLYQSGMGREWKG
ncbi:hypothetical protein GQ53DRAFT_802610 [Thozetella sp. PMI_491]|nr:hypothetical protein GQ53DRAFT_802610 [Thozetella sp. PMI_491]